MYNNDKSCPPTIDFNYTTQVDNSLCHINSISLHLTFTFKFILQIINIFWIIIKLSISFNLYSIARINRRCRTIHIAHLFRWWPIVYVARSSICLEWKAKGDLLFARFDWTRRVCRVASSPIPILAQHHLPDENISSSSFLYSLYSTKHSCIQYYAVGRHTLRLWALCVFMNEIIVARIAIILHTMDIGFNRLFCLEFFLYILETGCTENVL